MKNTSQIEIPTFYQGGIFLSPAKYSEYFDSFPINKDMISVGKIRTQVGEIKSNREKIHDFIKFIFIKILRIPPENLVLPKEISAEYSITSVLGEKIKPLYLLKNDFFQIPIFVPDTANFNTRPGVGRGKRITARAWEYLRSKDLPFGIILSVSHIRIVYVTPDSESFLEWTFENWIGEGNITSSFESFYKLLSYNSLLNFERGQKSILQKAVEETRTGESEVSEFLGERVRLSVETLLMHHTKEISKLLDENRADGSEIYRAATRVIMRIVVLLFAESREGLWTPPYFSDSKTKLFVLNTLSYNLLDLYSLN